MQSTVIFIVHTNNEGNRRDSEKEELSEVKVRSESDLQTGSRPALSTKKRADDPLKTESTSKENKSLAEVLRRDPAPEEFIDILT